MVRHVTPIETGVFAFYGGGRSRVFHSCVKKIKALKIAYSV